jgi:hypothetical protein
MNSYWYSEIATDPTRLRIEVKRGVVPIGNIRKNEETGRYEFFSGRDTVTTPMFEGRDLNTLKQRIKALQP